MKKIMTAIVFSCICAFALSFAPAPVSAGPFDDVIGGFSDDGNDKPAATPHKGGGGGGPKVADLEKRIKDLEDQAAKAPKPEAITSGNIHEYFIPYYIAFGAAILAALLGIILTVNAFGLRADVRTAKDDVSKLREELEGYAATLDELQEELEDDDPVAPPA